MPARILSDITKMFGTSPISERASLVVCLAALTTLSSYSQTSVTTQHNDIGRTGQNLTETTLTTSDVNGTSFGKLFTMVVDGQVYAQPLYLPSVTINGAAHRVVFVATEHDSVYAFDATTGNQLWKVTMLDTAHGAASGATTDPESDTGCTDIEALNGSLEYGITSTPVIDASTGTIYVEAETFENGYPVQRLHALDITSGAEKFGGPTTIQASVAGTGSGSSGGVLKFDPKWENQRSGLLLLNGNVYLAFASHCDYSPWHGWILGYSASSLSQTAVFVSTPNDSNSGIWMGGSGLAADVENGVNRIFPVTGNGTYDATTPYATNTVDYGDDILRLAVSSTGALSVADAFTPYNQGTYSADDADVGSGGALVLPDQSGSNPHLLVQLGKSGSLYLVNRDNLGGYNTSTNNIVQQLQATGGLWGMPAYWNGNVYVWPSLGALNQYSLTNGLLSSSPVEVSPQTESAWYGSTPSVSANGAQSGIVWSIDWSQSPEVLYAHNASNVSSLLWSSNQNALRDSDGTYVKFVVPTIADGSVYTGALYQVMAYGLLSSASPSFTVNAFPDALSIQPGATVAIPLTVTPINGYSGSPGFSISGLPSGVTGSFSGTSLTLSASSGAPASAATTAIITATASSTLSQTLSITVSVSTSAPPVPVNFSSVANVSAFFRSGTAVAAGGFDNNGTAYATNLLGPSISALGTYFTFGVSNAADAVANATISLPQGSFTTLNLIAAAANGNQTNQSFVVTYTDGTTSIFTQSVSDWYTPQSYGGETVALTVPYRLNYTGAVDNRTFQVYGYSFTLNSSKTVKSVTLPANRNVIVLAATLTGGTAPSFKLAATQSSINVAPGGSATDTVTVMAVNGFSGSVSLSASGQPSGLSASFATGSTAGTTNVTFTASSSITAGTYPVSITGTSGSISNSITINVTVTAPASFSLSASPNSVSVAAGNSATSNITITPSSGFGGTVTLSASGLPSGTSASFGTPSGGVSVLTLSTTSSASNGTYPITVTGKSGSLSSSTTVTLVITSSSPVEVSLSSVANVWGVFTNGTSPSHGGLDNDGSAYSANLLGSTLSSLGVSFAFGPSNAADTVANTTVLLPAGNFSKLYFLGTAVNGNQANQTFVVTYTDGSTSSFTQSLSDWYTPQSYAGETTASTMAYRLESGGRRDNRTFRLYAYSFALNSAKTVKSVRLPGSRNVTVLAITLK